MGYGLKRGGEAAVHSTRLYLKPQQVLLKVDVKNAVKTVRRDKILTAVRVLAPDLLHFVHSTYPSPSFVLGDKSLQSECNKVILSVHSLTRWTPVCWVPPLVMLVPSPTPSMRRSTSLGSLETDSHIWLPKTQSS